MVRRFDAYILIWESYTPSAACLLLPPSADGPPPSKREVWGVRRSRPPALPSIGYRGFAVAPMTLRAPSRSLLYNPGCRVETLLVSKGVMGFLGDLRGRNSKSPPNPLGLAERVPRRSGGRSLRTVEGVPTISVDFLFSVRKQLNLVSVFCPTGERRIWASIGYAPRRRGSTGRWANESEHTREE